MVSSVEKNESAAKLLPADVRERGALSLATAVGGSPPGNTYLEDGRTIVGQDADFAEAVAKALGLKLKREAASFEAILGDNKHVCEDAGEKPYSVKTYAEPGAIWGSLQQGRSDVVMSTINGLRYAVAHQEGLKFLGEYHRLDVGFAFKKGTKLARAFQAAVNQLIADGTYQRILKKWGTEGSAIETSRISPPEIKD